MIHKTKNICVLTVDNIIFCKSMKTVVHCMLLRVAFNSLNNQMKYNIYLN